MQASLSSMTSLSPPARKTRAAALHIAVVTETYPPEVNGVAMTTGRLLDGLVRRGHRVMLVRPRQGRADHARDSRSFSEMLVRSVPLPQYAGLRIGLPATASLTRLWARERPQIVHIVTEGPLGRSALLAARRLHIPVSSAFHTNFHSYSKHYGFGLLTPVVAAYLRRFHNQAGCTFVATHELEAQLAQVGYRGLKVIARGVDTELFTPARRSAELRRSWGARDDDIVVVYVGRLAPEKNMPVVFSAFDQVRRSVPAARLVLVGNGPQRAELERCHRHHIFAGMRHGEDLAAHYASGDLFLFPSLTETFGNVTLEAMASGLAVVAYDYAAAREHITHLRSGMLAPLDDADAFSAFAVEVAADAVLRDKLRHGARAVALGISWDKVIDDLAEALSGLALPLEQHAYA
jgi:glycosyltransferase involved in cell wall biosynthesis